MLRNSIDKRCVRCGLYIARTFTSEEICECAQPSLSEPPKQGETPMVDALRERLWCGEGVPICDQWDQLEALARRLESALKVAEEALKTIVSADDNGVVWWDDIAKGREALRAIEKIKGGV